MKISIEKVKAMILYFAEHTNPDKLGKTKLMKLFYFADFGYVKKHGVPMTFDQYKNLEHGPVPSAIFNLVSTLQSDPEEAALSDVIRVETGPESKMCKIVGKEKFSEKHRELFSVAEITVLGKVCSKFRESNKKEIEDESHREHPWADTEFLEDIPYSLAARDEDSVVSEKELELLSEILGK